MTRDDVIRMAREAGLKFERLDDEYCNAVDLAHGTYGRISDVDVYQVIRFAALVAAAERDECAQACEQTAGRWGFHAVAPSAALDCAKSIRARGEQ